MTPGQAGDRHLGARSCHGRGIAELDAAGEADPYVDDELALLDAS
jgi:hypothetical protein